MQIWVDADACPTAIKDIIFKAAQRRQIQVTLVANQYIRVPKSPFIQSMQVSSGFDEADNLIADRTEPGDLVITADIPLAARVVENGGTALNPRGTLYDKETVRSHLSRRDFMQELRDTGTITGGPAPLNKTHIQEFANEFDRYLTKYGG